MAELTLQKLNAALGQQTTTVREMLDKQTQAVHGLVKADLAPISERLDRQEAILESHTVTLDTVAKGIETMRIESAATRATLGRHEGWFQQLARKFGFRLN